MKRRLKPGTVLVREYGRQERRFGGLGKRRGVRAPIGAGVSHSQSRKINMLGVVFQSRWGSKFDQYSHAKHAATDFIRQYRGARPLLYAQGRGFSSILRAIEDHFETRSSFAP